jgi:hypothetical protein
VRQECFQGKWLLKFTWHQQPVWFPTAWYSIISRNFFVYSDLPLNYLYKTNYHFHFFFCDGTLIFLLFFLAPVQVKNDRHREALVTHIHTHTQWLVENMCADALVGWPRKP